MCNAISLCKDKFVRINVFDRNSKNRVFCKNFRILKTSHKHSLKEVKFVHNVFKKLIFIKICIN